MKQKNSGFIYRAILMGLLFLLLTAGCGCRTGGSWELLKALKTAIISSVLPETEADLSVPGRNPESESGTDSSFREDSCSGKPESEKSREEKPAESRAESQAESPAESRGESRTESPEESKGESRAESPEESKGESRTDSPEESRGESQAESPEESRGESQAESPEESRGESQAESLEESRTESPEESRKESRPESPETSQEESRTEISEKSRPEEEGTVEPPGIIEEESVHVHVFRERKILVAEAWVEVIYETRRYAVIECKACGTLFSSEEDPSAVLMEGVFYSQDKDREFKQYHCSSDHNPHCQYDFYVESREIPINQIEHEAEYRWIRECECGEVEE